MKKYVIAFDPNKCCACNACAIACIDQNDIDIKGGDVSFRRTYDNEFKTDKGYYCAYISSACMHCADAPCINACPAGCIQKDPDTGLTVYDNTNCIGCHSCAMACPFAAPRFRHSDGKMVKCDGCNERVKHGLKPACVRACTFGALQLMTEEDFQKQQQGLALHLIAKSMNI